MNTDLNFNNLVLSEQKSQTKPKKPQQDINELMNFCMSDE